MLMFPRKDLVVLAMPKCGTTALEAKLGKRAPVAFRGGGVKHVSMSQFERHLAPLLAESGRERSSYEVVSLFREPMSWVESWWRYRSREKLTSGPRQANFTGHLSFENFVETHLEGVAPGVVDGGSQSDFVAGLDGEVGVDRLFRYERFDDFVAYLEERLSRRLELEQVNVSPDHPEEPTLSTATRARLEEHLRRDYEIYGSIPG
ncbi:MAG: gamma-glutamyl kinase [Nocardioidaceae bacterium]|nr:gamma-glutamyl kinase [Nocardioidaceae bacterium]